MSSDSERSTDSSQGDDSTALRDATSQSSSTSLGTQTPDGKSRDAATHANVTPASEHDSSASSPVETLEADHLNASQTASEQKKGDAHNDEEDTESLSDVSEMSFGTVVTSQDWADGQGHAYFCEECGEEHWYDEEEEDEGSSDGSDGIHSLFEEDYIRKADLDSIRPMPSTGIQFLDLPDDILISIFLVLHPADALALSITSRTLASFANQRGGQLWKSYVIAQSLPCYADEDDSDPNHRRDVEGAVETMCHRCRDLGDIEDKYIHSDYYFCVRCVDWLGYKNAKGGNIRSPIKARAYIMNYKLRKRGLHRMHWDEFPESSDWVASGEGKASDIADRVYVCRPTQK